MKWAIYNIFLLVILFPLIVSSNEAGTDHDDVVDEKTENENMMEDRISNNKEESHSQDFNSDENINSDVLKQNILSEQIQKTESSENQYSIPQQNSMNDEHKKSVDDDMLKGKVEASLISDAIHTAELEEVVGNLVDQTLDVDNKENINPSTEGNDEGTSDLTLKTDENKVNSVHHDSGTGTSTKKQRYFPLLYTFGSMFTSFLAEFGEVSGSSDSASSNSSVVKNSTSDDELASNSNTTSNSTDQGKKTRFSCALHLKNTTTDLNGTALVRIINSTELLEILNFSKNQKSAASPCVLVMFYTKWCHFSARAAPEYNALARAFPQLDVLAVDTSHFSYLNAKFGTVAVPNIMIFHSRSAVRFNHTTRDLDHFIQFVHNNTGLEPTSSIAVLPEDFEGPLSSKVVQGRDWLLWLAWAFILVCSIYGFFFSLYGQAVIMRLRVLWAEHQHIE